MSMWPSLHPSWQIGVLITSTDHNRGEKIGKKLGGDMKFMMDFYIGCHRVMWIQLRTMNWEKLGDMTRVHQVK